MKWIVFGLVFLLALGCVGSEPQGQQPPTAQEPPPVQGGHFVVGEGEGTVVSQGESGTMIPATEYAETPNTEMRIYFLNVGKGERQGDAILIKKGDADILVDAGHVEKRQDLVTMLLERGVDDFELVVSTNDDPEHTGGFEYVSSRFKFGEIWRPEEGSAAYTAYLNRLGAEKVIVVGEGDQKIINGIKITVLNPMKGSERFFDVDNDGVVLKIEDSGFCMLLTGDILGSQQIVAQKSGPCQIVQWPNHGMGAGLTQINWFIEHTQPEIIVISGSASDWTNSRQSLKSAAVLGGIRNITVLENYRGKSVKITWDGSTYSAAVER